MEGLIELVAASFARNGIDCPAADLRSAGPASVGLLETMPSAANREQSAGATLSAMLPEHNFRKGPQGDSAL